MLRGGFREAGDASLEDALVAAAGAMPLFGPNSYGYVNCLDAVPLWPDQHGGAAVATGVAIVTQSSNLAINLSMQRRALPLAYLMSVGNQAQTGLADLASAVLDDPRVTALGLHVEGFGDIRAFEAMAARARVLAKPVVVLKAGRSAAARAAAFSHTASLAGASAVASAFLARLGLVEVTSPAVLIDALNLLHHGGPLAGPDIASVSCSAAGEPDGRPRRSHRHPLPPVRCGNRAPPRRHARPARHAGEPARLPHIRLGRRPRHHRGLHRGAGRPPRPRGRRPRPARPDRCDPAGWLPALTAIEAAHAATGTRTAVLAVLPENLDEATATRLAARSIPTLHGMADGLAAIDAAIRAGEARRPAAPAALAPEPPAPETLSESEAKAALAAAGVPVPRAVTAPDPDALAAAARALRFPVAVKVLGIGHKTEAGAVVLNLPDAAAVRAPGGDAGALRLPRRGDGDRRRRRADRRRHPRPDRPEGADHRRRRHPDRAAARQRHPDPAATPDAVRAAVAGLRLAPILAGYRNRPAADLDALVAAIEAIAGFAARHAGRLAELDVNPLIATPDGASAVDALVRLSR